ncbi:MAG: SGNH/GDSL hydrolase family protein [Elusimicrobia bacterium]|nr:SGNH/GDSL hydrolase family protein [Candidatus Liberimonas magnetica]
MKQKQLKDDLKFKHKISLSLFLILTLTIPFYLMGWPTKMGPYKPDWGYFLGLVCLSALLLYLLYRLNAEIPDYFKKIVFLNIFLLYFGIVFSLLAGEAYIRALKIAECRGGQGPLQPDFGLSKYKLNSLGFRGPEHNIAKEKGKLRVIALGDSQVFGQGVEWQDTFLEQLKTILDINTGQTFETINFGKCGWNTINEQVFFIKQGAYYKPDILILLYTLNDPEFDGYSYKPFFNSSFEVKYLWRSHLYFFLIKLYNQLKFPYEDYIINLFKDGSETAQYCGLALKNIASTCRNNNIRPLLVITPLFKDLKNYPFVEIHSKVRKWGENCGFYVIDLLPEFASRSKTGKEFRVSREDWHPNKEGHSIIAKAVGNKILEDRLYSKP